MIVAQAAFAWLPFQAPVMVAAIETNRLPK